MAGHDRTRLRALALGLALVVAGCAAAPRAAEREPLPPRAVAPPKAEAPPSEPPVATPPKPATVVVLEPGADAAAERPPETLAEAAARARAHRRDAPKPVAVINDKNLASFAAGQKLTEAAPESAAGAAPDATVPPVADGHDEAWWRQRGLELRRHWHDAVESVDRLEGEVAGLRDRFYATDDPYLRDSQVKPEWDRKLAELEAARRDAAAGPDEVARFLEEGRRAGALPGWLREGVELEPQPVVPTVENAEPGEPVVTGQEPPPR